MQAVTADDRPLAGMVLEVILFPAPTAGDHRRTAVEPRRQLRAIARDDLKEMHRESGTTTIYVTHDQVEAMGTVIGSR